MPTRTNSANGTQSAFKSNYPIPRCLRHPIEGDIVFRNGEWCSLLPSTIKKTWADCCSDCGGELKIGQTCGCVSPSVFMLHDELALVLSRHDYSEEYLFAIITRFVTGRKVGQVAKDWQVNLGSLKQFLDRTGKELDAA